MSLANRAITSPVSDTCPPPDGFAWVSTGLQTMVPGLGGSPNARGGGGGVWQAQEVGVPITGMRSWRAVRTGGMRWARCGVAVRGWSPTTLDTFFAAAAGPSMILRGIVGDDPAGDPDDGEANHLLFANDHIRCTGTTDRL